MVILTHAVMYFSTSTLAPVFQDNSKLVALAVMAIGIPFNFVPGLLPQVRRPSLSSPSSTGDAHHSEYRLQKTFDSLIAGYSHMRSNTRDWAQHPQPYPLGHIDHPLCHFLQCRSRPYPLGGPIRSCAYRGTHSRRSSRSLHQLVDQFFGCGSLLLLRTCYY